jgi:hypothetical protein
MRSIMQYLLGFHIGRYIITTYDMLQQHEFDCLGFIDKVSVVPNW